MKRKRQQPDLGQAEARSPEPHLGLLSEWQWPRYLGHLLLLSYIHQQKVVSKTERSWIKTEDWIKSPSTGAPKRNAGITSYCVTHWATVWPLNLFKETLMPFLRTPLKATFQGFHLLIPSFQHAKLYGEQVQSLVLPNQQSINMPSSVFSLLGLVTYNYNLPQAGKLSSSLSMDNKEAIVRTFWLMCW